MYANRHYWLPIIGLHLLAVTLYRPAVGMDHYVMNGDLLLSTLFGPNIIKHWPEIHRVNIEVEHLLKPFKQSRDLPGLPEGQFFEPIGFVRPLSSRIASPSMFRSCFTIASRIREMDSICLEQKPTETVLVRRKDRVKQISHFPFDLRRLHPLKTVFNPSKKTIVVIPGYLTDYEEWQHEIASYWLKLEDVNVILVHWREGNHRLMYESAAANVPLLARQITILLYCLAGMNGQEFASEKFRSSIHLVGHSLGAHVAGFVGKELGGQVDRITALDPAGPIFDALPEHERLHRSDAKFVDVLHTNAGQLRYLRASLGALKEAASRLTDAVRSRKYFDEHSKLSQTGRMSNNTAWFGIEEPLGHMDYYANGGSIQPGCQDHMHVCDHARAYELYISTLKREIAMRNYYGISSQVISEKTHRLFAFRQREYQFFQHGGQVHPECASFLLADTYGDARERSEAHKRCTVPIDFVSSSSELRRELREKYQLDLEQPGRKYYFETLDNEPYVANQLLMRVHTKDSSTGSDSWSDDCRMVSLVRPPRGEVAFARVDHGPNSAHPIHQDGFVGHIVPIANVNNWRQEFLTPDLLSRFREESTTSVELSKKLKPFLPPYVLIKLGYEDANSGLLKRFASSEKETKCSLTISAIELRSLAHPGVSTNLTLWYNQGGADKAQATGAGEEVLSTDVRKLERPIQVSTMDSAKHFFLSFVEISD